MNDVAYENVVARLFPGYKLELRERLIGGVSANVYRLDLRADNDQLKRVVVRVHRPEHTGHPANVEHELLTALHTGGLPVPKPLHYDLSGEQLVTPFIVMEFIDGSSTPPRADNNNYIELMAEALTTVHAFPTHSLPKLPARNNTLPEVFDYLPAGAEWEALHAHLRTIDEAAFHAPRKLLHGDFWPENLLWKANGQDNGTIAAILDWEDAAIGDPLSDVAGCGVELRYKLGKNGMERFTDAYAKHHAIDPQRLALWRVYVAAAAQKYMGAWGLDPTFEEHMRTEALATIKEAGLVLMGHED